MLRQIQDEILRLKKEGDITILAHCYQSADITEIADFVGILTPWHRPPQK